MYGISSFAWASQRRSSQSSRVLVSAGAPAMTATSSSMARFTAVPMAPEELSTCSSAGDTRSRNSTAPSAPRTGSRRATVLISLTACRTRSIAGCDFQLKPPRRNRRVNSQCAALALAIFACAGGVSSRTSALSSLPHAGRLLDRHDDVRTALAEPFRYRRSMNSGSGAFQGSCRWLSILPSFFGFRPSSRAICTWASER